MGAGEMMERGLGLVAMNLTLGDDGRRVDEGAGEMGSLGSEVTSETDGMVGNLEGVRDEDGVGRDGNEDEGAGFGEGTVLFTLRREVFEVCERNAGADDGGAGKEYAERLSARSRDRKLLS